MCYLVCSTELLVCWICCELWGHVLICVTIFQSTCGHGFGRDWDLYKLVCQLSWATQGWTEGEPGQVSHHKGQLHAHSHSSCHRAEKDFLLHLLPQWEMKTFSLNASNKVIRTYSSHHVNKEQTIWECAVIGRESMMGCDAARHKAVTTCLCFCYHPDVNYFPITGRTEMFICLIQQQFATVYCTQEMTWSFYLFLVTFNVVEFNVL